MDLASSKNTTRPSRSRSLPLGPALRTQQARELSGRLAPHVSGAVQLIITDNKSVMISVQRNIKQRRYKVRLHHLFIAAPDAVLALLGRYISFNDPIASRELNHFIDSRQSRIRPTETPMPARLRTDGRHYDLKALFDELNQTYFKGKVQVKITWGRNTKRGVARRSIKVGSYCVEQNLIRIHPGLDQKWIPDYYIRWVLFHEMLHVVHPIPVIDGRRQFHTNQFARDEQLFEQYDRAIVWEKQNLASLLCI